MIANSSPSPRHVGYMSPSAMLQQQQRERLANPGTPRASPQFMDSPHISLDGVQRMSPLVVTPKSRRSTGSVSTLQATPRSRRSQASYNSPGSARLAGIRGPSSGLIRQRSTGGTLPTQKPPRGYDVGSPRIQPPPSPVRQLSPCNVETDLLSNPGSYNGFSTRSTSSFSDVDASGTFTYKRVASDSRQARTVGTSQLAPIRTTVKTLSSVKRVRRQSSPMPLDVLSLVTPRSGSGNYDFRQEARRVARELHRSRRSAGSPQALGLRNRSAFFAVPRLGPVSVQDYEMSIASERAQRRPLMMGENNVRDFSRNDSVPSDISSFRVVNPYC